MISIRPLRHRPEEQNHLLEPLRDKIMCVDIVSLRITEMNLQVVPLCAERTALVSDRRSILETARVNLLHHVAIGLDPVRDEITRHVRRSRKHPARFRRAPIIGLVFDEARIAHHYHGYDPVRVRSR